MPTSNENVCALRVQVSSRFWFYFYLYSFLRVFCLAFVRTQQKTCSLRRKNGEKVAVNNVSLNVYTVYLYYVIRMIFFFT